MKKIIFQGMIEGFFMLLGLGLGGMPSQAASVDLAGKILLEVEKSGEAWYYSPVERAVVFLGRPELAWQRMREMSVKVNSEQLQNIEAGQIPQLLVGLLIQDESAVWYIDPKNKEAVRITGALDALYVMHHLGVGVASGVVDGLAQTDTIRPTLDLSQFENFDGWWGRIAAHFTAVMKQPSLISTRLGWFNPANRIKILEEVRGENINGNNSWYRIDGGAYPGAYVHSGYVRALIQPWPTRSLSIPEAVQNGEQWIDVDLGSKVLTMYNYDKPIFSTYVAVGTTYFPTRLGTYRIQSKLASTRMSGGPPRFPTPYDLPNVPYTMYYSGDFALHGTYWHDKFGTRQSHGCTNLTQGDAEYIYSHSSSAQELRISLAADQPLGQATLIYNHY